MATLHVIIPFLDEHRTLETCARRVVEASLPDGWTMRVILVDDGSADLSRDHAARLGTDLSVEGHDVTRLRHETNRGKGAAVATAFDHVLSESAPDGDAVIIQDADLEYDPNDYGALLEPIVNETADAVIGTRWGAHREIRGLKRRIHAWGNGTLTAMSNLMTGFRVTDMECCYKVLTMPTLRRVRPMLSEPRFGIEPQLVASLARLKARVTEVPVQYDPRGLEAGKKIGWTDGCRAIYVIMRERLRRRPTS